MNYVFIIGIILTIVYLFLFPIRIIIWTIFENKLLYFFGILITNWFLWEYKFGLSKWKNYWDSKYKQEIMFYKQEINNTLPISSLDIRTLILQYVNCSNDD